MNVLCAVDFNVIFLVFFMSHSNSGLFSVLQASANCQLVIKITITAKNAIAKNESF